MFVMLLSFLRSFRVYFQTRADLQTEIFALRHQIVVLQRQTPKPKLKPADRHFWIVLSGFWSRWRSALWIVKAATVIEWHRRGFMTRCQQLSFVKGVVNRSDGNTQSSTPTLGQMDFHSAVRRRVLNGASGEQ